MAFADTYTNWWNGEPDGAQGDTAWMQYLPGHDDAPLKHMGQQEDLFTAPTSAEPTQADLPLFHVTSMDDDGSFSSSKDAPFDDSILEDNRTLFDRSELHSLEESALASWGQGYGTCQSFEGSQPYENTPSLTMSPYTSYASEFGSLVGDNDQQLFQGKLSNDNHQRQGHAEKSDGKGRHTLTGKTSTATRHTKIACAEKTPKSHPIECRECQKRFRRRCDLRKHEKAVHISQDHRPHACKHCNRRFIWPKDVKRHVDRVHDKVIASNAAQHGQRSLDDARPQGSCLDSKILDIVDPDFDLYFRDEPYNGYFDPAMQQDWLCSNNNPDHYTFSRTHSPGEGSAPHRGARV